MEVNEIELFIEKVKARIILEHGVEATTADLAIALHKEFQKELIKARKFCCCCVKFLGKNGYDYELREAKKKITVGKEYYVSTITIDKWKTTINLYGISGDFNSVMFEPVDWIN